MYVKRSLHCRLVREKRYFPCSTASSGRVYPVRDCWVLVRSFTLPVIIKIGSQQPLKRIVIVNLILGRLISCYRQKLTSNLANMIIYSRNALCIFEVMSQWDCIHVDGRGIWGTLEHSTRVLSESRSCLRVKLQYPPSSAAKISRTARR